MEFHQRELALYFYGLPLLITLPIFSAASVPNLMVRATKIRGELYSLSAIRCSLWPTSQHIRHIEWIKGKQEDKPNYVYFDSTDPSAKNSTRKRGSFESRNVSGSFLHEGSAHELKIYRSLASDEDVYTCAVWTKAEEQYSSKVNLTLNVQPKTAPSIQALDGRVLSTSDCDQPDIAVVQWTTKISLYCMVGAAKPRATVRWQSTSGGVNQHKEDVIPDNSGDGLQLFSVKRRVDKTLRHDEQLRCTVNMTNPGNDSFQLIDLCVWVHLYDPPKAYKFSWITNGVVTYLVVLFLCAWLIHRALYATTGTSGRLINHSTWYLIALVFLANTFTILHIKYDHIYHAQLLKKYQKLPDDPYLMYHAAWFWFGLIFFSSRLGSGIISTMVWKIYYRKPENRQNETGQQLNISNTSDGNNEENHGAIANGNDVRLKRFCRILLRVLLGPGVLLLLLMCQVKRQHVRAPHIFHKRVAATIVCVVHRLVFQSLYLVSGIVIYCGSIPIGLSSTDMTSLQSPRIPTVILFVVLALDIVVNAFIVVFLQIKEQRRTRGNRNGSN